MYEVLLLPHDDDYHMPPSGKPQLSSKEIWLLKHWIDAGAHFDKKIADHEVNDTLRELAIDYLILPKDPTQEARYSDLVKVRQNGFRVNKLVFGEPYLRVSYEDNNVPVSKKALSSLTAIADQLIELDLKESGLTDGTSNPLRKLNRLERLRLDGNQISAKTLSHIRTEERLEHLNLFDTGITALDLQEVMGDHAPHKVVLGNEGDLGFDDHVVLDETEIQAGIVPGFIEKTQLGRPTIVGDRSIFDSEITVEIKGQLKNERIYYTLDGQDPDSTSLHYTEPVTITDNSELKAIAYKDGWYPSEVVARNYNKVGHIISDISVKYPPREQYPGIHKLIDLSRGSANFRDGKWNGYQDDVIATLDMGESIDFKTVVISCMEGIGSYIFFPTEIEIHAGSSPETMTLLKGMKLPPTDRDRDIKLRSFELEVAPVEVRYIKVVLKNIGKLPEWHEGAGADAWIFVDEIMIL
jgi:hypothetical protein